MNIPQLKMLFLYITWHCNMHCKHCWVPTQPSSDYNHQRTMPSEVTFSDLKNAIVEAKDLGLNTIKITGGEPYVRKKLVNELLELSSNIGVQSIIETNGTLLDEKDVVALKKYEVREVSISIDFSDAKRFDEFRGLKDGYLRVLEAMKLFHKYKVNWIGIMTVTKLNLNDISHVAEIVFKYGAKMLKLDICMPMGRAKEHHELLLTPHDYVKLFEEAVRVEENFSGKVGMVVPFILPLSFEHRPFQIARSVCEFKNLLSILPNGDISLCGLGGEHPEAIFGNIRHDSIKEIWTGSNELLDEIRSFEPDKINGVCRICVFRKYCANLCPALVYEKYGTFLASFPICQELYDSGMFNAKYLIEDVM
ncbi:MAG: hypothetical protein PWQ72_2094 [Pseudothermotoga sp.]|nr:hypothetical protein [Pseudothermotoga sp.]